MKLGGFTMIKDGDALDYCWRQTVQSLLDVCDVVSVSVASQNMDDCEHRVRAWAEREPRLLVNIYPWPNPVGNPDFFVDWIQYARQHTPADYVLELDADEVLHENSYGSIQRLKERDGRFSVRFHRYNFWKDAQHVVPHGVNCSHVVTRLAPQNVWMPSDGPHPNGQEMIMMQIDTEGPLEIMHYGFLRKPDAFFKKAKAIQGYFFNSYDPRLAKAETMAGNWMENCEVGWEDKLLPFTGTHPARMQGWLESRGYHV